jgi:aspartate 1-decarboxylase
MMRTMLKSKIHRATVTEANVEYEGSITIDADLIEAADLLPYEQVDVLDITNGARLSTYVIEGERGSGEICINGAAAHLIKPHDLVIICSYVQREDAECRGHEGIRVFVDRRNNIREIAGPSPVLPRV